MSAAPDGGWGWIVVAAITVSNLAVLPIQQCFGLVFEQRFKNLGITATETSLILHLNSSIMCSLGFVNGPLLKRFSYRTVVCLGTGFIFAGICLAAFADSMATIIVAYCVFVAIGQGMMYPGISLALNTYFSKRRSVAMGLTITLTGLGPVAMPQLIAVLLESYGTKGTIVMLAGVALHSFVGGCLLRPLTTAKISDVERDGVGEEARRPVATEKTAESSEIPEELKPLRSPPLAGEIPEEGSDPGAESRRINGAGNVLAKISESLDLDLLRNNRFLVIVLGMSVTLVSELNFSQMTPFVLAELAALTPPEIATLMSIQASADITGRLCVPLLAQRFGWSSRTLYASSLVGSTIGRSVLASWSGSYPVIIAVFLLVGLAKGTKAVFQALVIPDNVPLVKLPAASGLLMVCNGVLSIALGPLIGLVHDETRSYVAALHFTSALSMSCVLLWTVERFYVPRGRPGAGETAAEDDNRVEN